MQTPHLPSKESQKAKINYSKDDHSTQRVRAGSFEVKNQRSLIFDESQQDQSFISKTDSLASFNLKKSILKPHSKYDSTELTLSNQNEAKKSIRFSKTEVHVVENWKEYNRHRKFCGCFSFLFFFN